jgi:hypothetical protein
MERRRAVAPKTGVILSLSKDLREATVSPVYLGDSVQQVRLEEVLSFGFASGQASSG